MFFADRALLCKRIINFVVALVVRPRTYFFISTIFEIRLSACQFRSFSSLAPFSLILRRDIAKSFSIKLRRLREIFPVILLKHSARCASKMKFFLVLVLSFFELKSFEQSSLVELCREQRAQNNGNCSENWRNLSAGSDDVGGSEDDATKINMTGRCLKSIRLTTFESLDKPRTAILDLSINSISDIEYGAFQSLQNLRILKLRINNLRDINSSTFGSLMMLEELDLSLNLISFVNRDAFRLMINLHTIDLSENCMLQLPNYLFFRNVRLTNIYLKHNHLFAIPILMPTHQFVDNFNVSGNNMTNMTSFSQYNNIQSLDLSNNPLIPEEMASDSADVVQEGYSSSESDENNNYNYLNVRYASDANSYIYHSSLNSVYSISPTTQQNPLNGRYRNRKKTDFAPDVNFMATSNRARMNIMLPAVAMENSDYNRKLECLMDSFRPNRMSESALESLIKTIIAIKTENFKVSDIIQVFNAITSFYRNQNRQTFRQEMERMRQANEGFDVASFMQFVQNSIGSQVTRTTRESADKQRSQYTPEQLQQLLIQTSRMNQLKYFSCRNCSLVSLNFLVNFPELQYINVAGNKIKIVNEEQLRSTLNNIRYLDVSDNEIESLNFTAMIESWPNFDVLKVNNNSQLSCGLINQMHYKVTHLNKMFKLEVDECK